jgi:hypothetical protein
LEEPPPLPPPLGKEEVFFYLFFYFSRFSLARLSYSAIISLLNDQQLNAGRPPLGFLNPWLYQTAASTPDAFFDVTIGNNPDSCCTTGFSCAPGWDAVTGLGTPNYQVLFVFFFFWCWSLI